MSDTPGEGMTRRCWWPTCNIICIFLHILRTENMSIQRIEKEGYIDLHAFWKNGSLYPSLGRKKRRGPSRIGSWLKINTQWRWFGIHIPKLYGQIVYLNLCMCTYIAYILYYFYIHECVTLLFNLNVGGHLKAFAKWLRPKDEDGCPYQLTPRVLILEIGRTWNRL